jgi:type I restriction enzyme, R subunit
LQRVSNAKPAIAKAYVDAKQQEFIDFILDKYLEEGVKDLATTKMRALVELKYNTIADAAAELGSTKTIRETFIGFQKFLYVDAAQQNK